MKKLFFAFLAMTMFACSSDDSAPVNPDNQNPENPTPTPCSKVYNGNVVLSTQAEVDAFAAKGYCTIKGNIMIGPRVEAVGEGEDMEIIVIDSDITSIAGFSSFIKIEGSLTISENLLLTSINGLNNLESISGSLSIQHNSALAELTPLSSVKYVGINNSFGDLVIRNNDALTSLQGLQSIEEVDDFFIENNDHLQNLNGLNGLKNVNVMFGLANNPELSSFQGLENLQYVKSFVISSCGFYNFDGMGNIEGISSLTLSYLPNLVSIEGLQAITEMDSFKIIACDALQSCNGVQNIKTLGNLIISGNDSLATLSHFSGLTTLSTSPFYSENKFEISSNDALQSLEGFQNITIFKAELYVYGNDELKDFCSLTSLLNVGVFIQPAYIADNLYNPTVAEIVAGNCSQ